MIKKILICDICKVELQPSQSSPMVYAISKVSPPVSSTYNGQVYLLTANSTHLDICRDCLKDIRLTN